MSWTDWMTTREVADYLALETTRGVLLVLNGKRQGGALSQHEYESRREGRRWLVRIREDGDEEHEEASPDWNMPSHEPVEGWVERDGYIYDGDRDVYIVHLPSHSRPFVRPGDWVRAVWRKYTSGATIADVTREFAIDRKTFVEFKTKLSLTKTRSPFTDEEIARGDVDELAEDGLRMKERELSTKIERKHWRQVKNRAEKYALQHEWAREALAPLTFDKPVVHRVKFKERQPHTVFVGWTDVHVGKRDAYKSHTIDTQIDKLRSLIDNIYARVETWGAPERFILPIGSDLLHVDSKALTTTRGTTQGGQSSAHATQAAREAIRITDRLIGRLAQIAPVDCYWIPGNHDWLASYLVAEALSARWAGVRGVEFHTGDNPRKYTRVGQTPIMMTHGDKEKSKQLPLLLARETGWGIQGALIFTGHLHGTAANVVEEAGVMRWTLPAPCSADDWHHENGYVGNRECVALFRIDPERGLLGMEWVDSEHTEVAA